MAAILRTSRSCRGDQNLRSMRPSANAARPPSIWSRAADGQLEAGLVRRGEQIRGEAVAAVGLVLGARRKIVGEAVGIEVGRQRVDDVAHSVASRSPMAFEVICSRQVNG